MAESLRPTLGLVQLTFYSVGAVVGAGIYSIIGTATAAVGEGVWISMALASVIAFVTALSYAELISAYPHAGAEFHFLKNAFPHWPLLPYVAGLLLALNAAATAATVALAFGNYLAAMVAVPALLSAVLLLVLCTGLNVLGLRESTWLGITCICIEVGGLLLLIGGSLATTDITEAITWPAGETLPALLPATALLFFVYLGFESIANLAEEAHAPTRNVPRALLLSVVVTSAIYLLVIWSALALTGPAPLAASDSVLRTVGNAIDPRVGSVLTVTALFATASTALISLVSVSRVLFGMAREGALPAALARLTPGRRTPWVAALVLFALSVAVLAQGDLKVMAGISSFGLLLVFSAVQLALIVLRYTAPQMARPFRIPGALGRLPLLPAAGLLATVLMATQFEPVVYGITLGMVALVLLARALLRRRR
jgi:APA family basic amino acid/polyamine antiporter